MAEKQGIMNIASTHAKRLKDTASYTQESMASARQQTIRSLKDMSMFGDKGKIGAIGQKGYFAKLKEKGLIGSITQDGKKSFVEVFREKGFMGALSDLRKKFMGNGNEVSKEEQQVGLNVQQMDISPPGAGTSTATTASPSETKTLGMGIKVKGL